MITVVSGIIMLGILVFVHELGHFCVAKLAGVKVLKFSLGFGPRIVSRQYGETEYMICAVPLGGYVQMLGEGGEEGDELAEMSPEEKDRSFANKSVWRRTAIISAGPIMNLALPFLILPLAFLIGVSMPAFLDESPCVGYVAENTAAERAGFESGDCLTALNDEELESWNDANKSLVSYAGEDLLFEVERNTATVELTIPAAENSPEGLQSLGLLPDQPATIGNLSPGMPAEDAGLQAGDRIVAIDGQPVRSWYELKEYIQQAEGSPQTFTFERDGQKLKVELQAEKAADSDYLIGIAPQQDTVIKRFGPIESIKEGSQRTTDLIGLTLVFIQKLFSGQISSESIGGPITVVQVAGQAAQTDFSSILFVLAFLSIQLGILNLLPIPILDGGHLFFNLFEMVRGRPLSLRAREVAQQIGLILIVMLMLLAFYNDFARLFSWGQGG